MSRYDKTGPDADWRSIVKSRSDNTCAVCKKKSSPFKLHAHHLYSYADYPDKRIDINNGIALCKKCHFFFFHDLYGRGNNTKEQFELFLKQYGNKAIPTFKKMKPLKRPKFRKFKVKHALKSPNNH